MYCRVIEACYKYLDKYFTGKMSSARLARLQPQVLARRQVLGTRPYLLLLRRHSEETDGLQGGTSELISSVRDQIPTLWKMMLYWCSAKIS